jgi:heme/copper-type cytochrome/quinol oxidase subunit 3
MPGPSGMAEADATSVGESVPADFQYASRAHQGHTAIAGMWLFLATESLFFGALFLAWVYCRY